VRHSSAGAHFLQKPTVVIADDSSEILSVTTEILSRQYSVVGRVLNGKLAVDAVLNLRPDVVVLDIQMPELDGIQAARRLQAAGATAKVVFLTGLEDADYVSHVLNLGPYSYVFKTRCHADLPLAIAAALEGKVFCSSRQEDANAIV
jgi:DNA-binding NarL/FixJ family response regulator